MEKEIKKKGVRGEERKEGKKERCEEIREKRETRERRDGAQELQGEEESLRLPGLQHPEGP